MVGMPLKRKKTFEGILIKKSPDSQLNGPGGDDPQKMWSFVS